MDSDSIWLLRLLYIITNDWHSLSVALFLKKLFKIRFCEDYLFRNLYRVFFVSVCYFFLHVVLHY